MSMSRGCLLVEYAVGEWYCIIARDEHDYEYKTFDIFGPCNTEDEAFEKMSNQCCNPGSSSTATFGNVSDWAKEVIEEKYK
jgi:hypothetical protein